MDDQKKQNDDQDNGSLQFTPRLTSTQRENTQVKNERKLHLSLPPPLFCLLAPQGRHRSFFWQNVVKNPSLAPPGDFLVFRRGNVVNPLCVISNPHPSLNLDSRLPMQPVPVARAGLSRLSPCLFPGAGQGAPGFPCPLVGQRPRQVGQSSRVGFAPTAGAGQTLPPHCAAG